MSNLARLVDFAPILSKLDSIVRLSSDEKLAVAGLPVQVAKIAKGQEIIRKGERPTRCFAMLNGVAHSYKVTGSGLRQITAVHIAGDLPDLQSLHLQALDVSIAATTSCKIAFVQHEAVRKLCDLYPRITSAFWHDTLVSAAISREWVTNLGQRAAVNRIAHLVCEILVRSNAAGLVKNETCTFPFTQAQLGEATGMSSVHVNRSIQQLRAMGLLRLKNEVLMVRDWPAMKRVGDFDPSYLNLRDREPSAPSDLAA